MPEYREIYKEVTIPKGTGVEGYLETIRGILKKPRVQEVVLKTSGRVSYKRFALQDEPEDEVQMDFDSLMPYGVIRSGEVEEIEVIETTNAAVAIGELFNYAMLDGLNPVLFAGGTASKFWKWHEESTGVDLQKFESLYGLPYMPDTNIPNETLLLCAAYSRDAKLVDVRKSYKISVPNYRRLP